MENAEIKSLVKEKYSAIAKAQGEESCCGPTCCGPVDIETADDKTSDEFKSWSESGFAMIGHEYESLEGYVADADLKLGCGIPTKHAGFKEGQTVLDLGSGAGNDCFIARNFVGESGKVIGLDFSEQMLELANKNQEKMGFKNMEFVHGEIENIPLEENSVDVVVSNCVMNLVPDKRKAYSETFRVLKSGGHFSISDIVYDGNMPEEIKQVADLLTGCVSGAIPRKEYLDVISDAGFENVEVKAEKEITFPNLVLEQYAKGVDLSNFKIYSLTINGFKA